ncbi:hypothetical protein NW762_003298 [Fusarium torreyae]|uniref:Heterokaryon incompatibility domain-containing protein n=1 Tax=Fusarium torreyae TaxID=1237075 RepID=A0A9W8SAQ0_9HYPO|nr:hypothetical protein NW762_003298 [Fusarium torreyae]
MSRTRTRASMHVDSKDHLSSELASAVTAATGQPSHRSLTYQQLEPRQRQIRILHLLPGQFSDPVRCELHTASLSSRPSYEALSYSWGDPHDCHVIEVDSREVDITSNLFNALRRLRLSIDKRQIWVDALCINQTDDTEKSHQIGLMRDIYSSTTEAILWLGDFKSVESEISPASVQTAAVNHISEDNATTAFALLRSMAANRHWNNKFGNSDESVSKRESDALSALLNLSWWQRAWTVQETVLPKKATLHCGTTKLPLSEVMLAHITSLMHDRIGCCATNPQIHDVLYKFWVCIEGFRLLQKEPNKSILVRMALEMFRFRRASDPRDYVYAYLGLGSRALADYTISHEAAYKYVVRSLIHESRNLGPLVRIAEQDRSFTLPTWCPDYHSKSNPGNSEFFDQELGWLYMYSWYHTGGRTGPKVRFSLIDSRLEVQGIVVDQIMESGGPMYTREDKLETISKWHHRDPRGCQWGSYEEVGWCPFMLDICVVFSNKPRDYTMPRTREGFEIMINELWHPEAQSQLVLFQYQTFTTDTGLLGHARVDIRAGDVVCVLLGGNMPFILRPADADGTYTYVGQAYVHGIMDGEALQQGRDLEWIILV